MKFRDTYTKDKTKEGEESKELVSADAFAIGDAIQELSETLDRLIK